MPNQRKFPTATYSIPPELRERAKAEAAKEEVSEGEIVRRALQAYFDNLDNGVLHH